MVAAPELIGMVNGLRRASGTKETAAAGRIRRVLIVVMLPMGENVVIVLPQVGMVSESVTETRNEEGIGMEIGRGTETGTVNVVENAIRIRTIVTIGTRIVNAATDIAETRKNGSEEMVVGGRGTVLDVAVVSPQMIVLYLLVRILHGIAPSPQLMKVLESDDVRPTMRYVAFGLLDCSSICLVIDLIAHLV